MKVTVDIRRLEETGDACAIALRKYLQSEWAGSFDGEWDLAHQMKFLRSPLGRYMGWLVKKGLVVAVPMDRASFKGERLTGVHFGGASLRETDFSGALLHSANFQACDLRGANFSGADLFATCLRDADIRGACFDGARLYGADLTRAVRS